MAAAVHRIAPSPMEPDRPSDTAGKSPAALTALLDHLAEELAREYVRLMDEAAQQDAPAPDPLPEV